MTAIESSLGPLMGMESVPSYLPVFSLDLSFLDWHPFLEGYQATPRSQSENSYRNIVLKVYKPCQTTIEAMDYRFDSVSEMVNAGYCIQMNTRKLIRIPKGTRIGIPDDDVTLEPWECQAMEQAACNLRDEVGIGMLLRTGARISQVLWIGVWDINWVKKEVFINRMKEGDAFHRELDSYFMDKLARYVRHYRLRKEDYLFCIHYTPNSDVWHKKDYPCRRKEAGDIIKKAAEKAGIQYRYVDHNGILRWRVHPHTTKYTWCSMGYQATKDLVGTARAVGNKSIACLLKSYIFTSKDQKRLIARAVQHQMFGPKQHRLSDWVTKSHPALRSNLGGADTYLGPKRWIK